MAEYVEGGSGEGAREGLKQALGIVVATQRMWLSGATLPSRSLCLTTYISPRIPPINTYKRHAAATWLLALIWNKAKAGARAARQIRTPLSA